MNVVSPKPHRRAPRLGHAGKQHLLHQESRFVRNHLPLFRPMLINHISVAVLYAGDKRRDIVFPSIHYRTIGIDHLVERHIRCSQSKRRSRLQRRTHTDTMRHVYNVIDTDLIGNSYRYGINRTCKSIFQGHRASRIIALRITRRPLHRLPVTVESVILAVLVDTFIARRKPIFHRRGINKQLERGTRLPMRRHLIIFPMVEIHIAYPRLYLSSLRLHGKKPAMHEPHHIAYGIHRAKHHILRTILIIKHLHAVWIIHIIFHRVRIVRKKLRQSLICISMPCNVLNESRYFMMICVLPRIRAAPITIEITLHLLHMLHHRLLGIALHTRVNRSVYLQAVAIQIIAVFLAPFPDTVGKLLPEI